MSATSTYHELLKTIQSQGYHKENRTGVDTISTFGRQVRFNMKEGFPLLTTKKVHVKSVIHELLWFLKGDTNIDYLNANGVTIWDEWADRNGDLGPVYGKQWVDWTTPKILKTNEVAYGKNPVTGVEHAIIVEGIDYRNEDGDIIFEGNGINQIQQAIERLQTNPDCRRIMVTAWNPSDLSKMALMPCHYGFQIWTRQLNIDERFEMCVEMNAYDYENCKRSEREEFCNKHDIPTRAISLAWNQRSVDTFLGLPFNIASYGFLLHMIAQQVNMVPEDLIGFLGDTHLYENHLEFVEKQLDRNPYERPAPKLILNKAPDIFSYKFEDFEIAEYDPFPNWKNVPIAV